MCAFCADKVESIGYKDVSKLRKHISEKARSFKKDHQNYAKHQRQLTSAIKKQGILHYCLSLPNKINAHIKNRRLYSRMILSSCYNFRMLNLCRGISN